MCERLRLSLLVSGMSLARDEAQQAQDSIACHLLAKRNLQHINKLILAEGARERSLALSGCASCAGLVQHVKAPEQLIRTDTKLDHHQAAKTVCSLQSVGRRNTMRRQ